MNDEHNAACMIRLGPNSVSTLINVTVLDVIDTEHLLDDQEELISTPLQLNIHSSVGVSD
jgi:hypothetical protein